MTKGAGKRRVDLVTTRYVSWLVCGLFAIFVLGVVVLGFVLQDQAKRSSKEAAKEALHSSVHLSTLGLNIWLAERFADAEVIGSSPLLNKALQRWLAKPEVADAEAIQQHLDSIRGHYAYRAIALIDPLRRAALFHSGPAPDLAQLQVVLGDGIGEHAQWIEVPPGPGVPWTAGVRRPLGQGGTPLLLYLEIDPRWLASALSKAQPLNWNGETLLVRRNEQGLWYLSSAPGAGLQVLAAAAPGRTRNPEPFAEELLSRSGASEFQGRNRLGTSVLAMAERVNIPGWTLVSQLSDDAVYSGLHARTRVLAFALGGLLLLGLLTFITWRWGERSRSALREAGLRRNYERMLRSSQEIFVLYDDRGTILDASNAAIKAYGYPREQMLGMSAQRLNPIDAPVDYRKIVKGLVPGESRPFQEWRQKADGSNFMLDGSIGLFEYEGQRYYLAIGRDVTRQREVATALRVASSFFERSMAAIVISDPNRNIVQVNPAFSRITGYEPQEVIGKPTSMINANIDPDLVERARASLQDDDFWEGELRSRRKDGSVFPSRLFVTAYRGDDGAVEQYVGIFTDLTRLKQAESQAEYLARHDPLTDLPNRAQLERELPSLLDQAQSQSRPLASLSCVLVNLDQFKGINESFGSAQGDALLVEVATRLRQLFPESRSLYRYGGDEFVLILRGNPVTNALQISSVRAALAAPVQLGDHAVSPTASIGMASFPDQARSAEELMHNTEAAMRMAKAQGRNTWRLYQPEMNAGAFDDMLLAVDLRQALGRNELHLVLQPQFRLVDGALVGAEALLRWTHGKRGNVSPSRFIPIAESSGMIVEISQWVLREAASIWSGLRDQGLAPPPIAVNLSAVQFQSPDFIPEVARVMAEFNLPGNALEMELTEGLIMDDTDAAIERMLKLVDMGIQMAIDDFGTGYSSLSYLRRFPIRKLKIDRSFILDLGRNNREGAAIATAVIGMAKSLNLRVIAEGVETLDQRDYLLAQGCDEVQGYLYARPTPVDEFSAMLREGCRQMSPDTLKANALSAKP